MSFDIKIQNKCDHRINWEQYPIEDRKTITVAYPVASTSSLRMRINNVEISSNEYTVRTVRLLPSQVWTSSLIMTNNVKFTNPIVEVSFLTRSDTCPKCAALNALDDVVYNQAGDFLMVNKEYMLLQSVEKIIVTRIQSNLFHDWYGTGLQDLIGTKMSDFDFLKTKIMDQISASVTSLKNLQRKLLVSGRSVDPGELFGQILSLDVAVTDDPTILLVTMVFTSQSNRTLEYSQLIDTNNFRERVAFT